jgi:cytoskeletal protein RodZ
MSRKSKRRRNRFGPAAAPGAIESAAFEFVDDRTAGATAADFVVAGSEAEAATADVPAVQEAAAATPTAGAIETRSAPVAPMAAPVAAMAAPFAAPVVAQRTLGEMLIAAREARGLTLEEASARTRISIPTLRNLEGDRFEAMAAAAYARGFLRSYGAFLRLDVGALLQQYEKLTGTTVETAVPESWEPEVRRSESSLPRWAMWVAAVMGIVVVAGGVVYGVRSRQSAGTGGDLKQIEAELRAAQTETATTTASAPAPAAVEVSSPAALPATLNAIHTAAPIASAEDTSAPVHETQATASAGTSRGVVTDMVQVETPPPPEASTATAAAPAPALVADANPAAATGDAGLAPAATALASADGLVLTVTARDSC